MTNYDRETDASSRKLTGRGVLLCLLAFFGVVFAVNAVMIRFATGTFGGVETASSYAAGLAFKKDLNAAEQQDALGWQVKGGVARIATLFEHTVELMRAGNDRANGEVIASAGQWDLILEISQDNGPVFRSRSRIVLR